MLAFFLSLPLKGVVCGGGFCEVHVYYLGMILGSTYIISHWSYYGDSMVSSHHSLRLVLVYAGKTRDKMFNIIVLLSTKYVLCPVLRSLTRELNPGTSD